MEAPAPRMASDESFFRRIQWTRDLFLPKATARNNQKPSKYGIKWCPVRCCQVSVFFQREVFWGLGAGRFSFKSFQWAIPCEIEHSAATHFLKRGKQGFLSCKLAYICDFYSKCPPRSGLQGTLQVSIQLPLGRHPLKVRHQVLVQRGPRKWTAEALAVEVQLRSILSCISETTYAIRPIVTGRCML